MIEIIAVLVIVGVLAAVAVARFSDAGSRDVAVANMIKSHLRYAQLRAMGDTKSWGISFSGNSYTLIKVKDGKVAPAPVNLPGEDSRSKEVEHVNLGNDIVVFSHAFGRPERDVLTIYVGDRKILISEETGFIP